MTPKQERFVEEYLIDLNATAAAARAGYKGKYLDRIGPELLGKTSIAAAIASARAKLSERTELTQDEVITGLRTEAKYAGEGAQHSARVKAWELLGKYQGMFPEQHQHTGSVQLEIVEEIVVASHPGPAEANGAGAKNGTTSPGAGRLP
jgi:phage terminase small subunit